MTNKEKYKQAFSVLHTSDISEGEVKYMAVAAQNFCQNFSKLLTKLFGKYFRYL